VDNLEKYITDNKAAFDDLKAPPSVWKGIERKLEPKVHHIWKWSAMAASALLLVAVGYIFGMRSSATDTIAGWEQFEKAEEFYQSRINVRLDKINALPVSDEVMADIKVLDEVYQQLREELLRDPNADAHVLLATMIKHQKQKLEVLDKILDRVNQHEPSETNTNHEM
jgi:hypothetical protein